MRKFLSRKLWVTILGALVGTYKPELLPLLKILLPSYLVAQGAVDVTSAIKERAGSIKVDTVEKVTVNTP